MDEISSSLDSLRKRKLLIKFHELAASGHSIFFIEHDIEMLKYANYLIELGPKAGKEGGKLLFCGPPKELPSSTTSILKNYLRF